MRQIAPLVATLLLAGCGSGDFTCSSAPVVEQLTAYFKNATASVGVPLDFDASKTVYRFENARQIGGNDHQRACAATFYTTMVPKPGATYDKAALEWANNLAQPINYTVEKLDKGGVYVTVR
ncbi:hypothetical protein IVA78_21205 [Bradyrhizobium sp. 137]|uniref:hypothetical protein n=1 Tax=Bradyrhizobium sp. 137 TaxID=2782614 RepID=UPI001FF9A5D8|nr:hypothetical protein [Bradyrhizobium sp. 137]MCK1757671.1 hypothetical protein [Bradyrhizobium sp. 137]